MTPRKLTDEQVERIRQVVRMRKALPTNAQLAVEMDCCKRLIDQFTTGKEYKFHVEPTVKRDSVVLSDEQRLKMNARSAAKMAQRRGTLLKQPCENCGAEKAEKHHEDYTKALEVRWLCAGCHREVHANVQRSSMNV